MKVKKLHRSRFTKDEAECIMNLLNEKTNSKPNKQKGIRQKIRNIGFYITDFDDSYQGFTTEDFKRLIKDGKIKIN